MAVTEWHLPTNVMGKTRPSGITWVNKDNALISNDIRTSVDLPAEKESHYLLAMEFRFTSIDVPQGSVINGVEVKYERQSDNENYIQDVELRLYYEVFIGENKIVTPSQWKTDEDEMVIFGGPDDLWGAEITQEIVCGVPDYCTAIAVGIAAVNIDEITAHEARIDCVWLRVYFTPPADPDTGWKSPKTVENVAREHATAWSDPENAKESDDNRAIANVTGAEYSDFLHCTDFEFTNEDIPAGSTIDGIKVKIERQAENRTRITDNAVYLHKTSGQVGDNKASAMGWLDTGDDEAPFYGGAVDLWNAGLTLDDILSEDFGVDISAQCSSGKGDENARVDSVKIGIYYTLPVCDISGYVKESDDTPVSGVTMDLSPGGSTITNSSGYYEFTDLVGGNNYTVTPSKTGWTFSPLSKDYNPLSSDQINQNYIGNPPLYDISGYVREADSTPVSGVTINLSGHSTSSTTTNSSGYYKFANLEKGYNYVVIPSKTGWTFNPSGRSYDSLSSDQTNQDYTAEQPQFKRTFCEKHPTEMHEYETHIDEAREHKHTVIYDPDGNLLVKGNERAEEDELVNKTVSHEEETHIGDI